MPTPEEQAAARDAEISRDLVTLGTRLLDATERIQALESRLLTVEKITGKLQVLLPPD